MKHTNEYRIRNLWTTEQLAKVLLRCHLDVEFEYPIALYTTGDGERFKDYDEAILHEIWWLSQESED